MLKIKCLTFRRRLMLSDAAVPNWRPCKMAKLYLVVLIVITYIALIDALKVDCPLSSKMTTCSPKCKDDTECFGQKCCPNICNTKSCTTGNQLSSSNTGYKDSKSGATGTYCGNVKCNAYEKCEMDKTSKREKCVRH